MILLEKAQFFTGEFYPVVITKTKKDAYEYLKTQGWKKTREQLLWEKEIEGTSYCMRMRSVPYYP